MGKKLVIVESPTKSRTLSQYLGSKFKIVASMGHIIDLAKRQLSVDIKAGFKPRYQIIPGKKEVLNVIKNAASTADEIFLASDPDREGEAIAYHIAKFLGVVDTAHRVLFNEITKSAVLEGIENPTKIDMNKVYAQQARRILDRLVGYKVSPILWRIIRSGLSAGRVQSVALKILAKREKELEEFVPKEYWTIDLILSKDEHEFPAKVTQFRGEKLELSCESDALAHRSAVEKSAPFYVLSVERKKQRRNPPPPFITSTMQLEASRRLGFSAKKTMMLAQQLYEGIELGDEGPAGLITYMRTDSVRVADVAVGTAKKFIKTQFGDEYVGRIRHGTKKTAQDAHEAIRPTYPARTPQQIKQFLNKEQFALYELIWKRFIASQMSHAQLERVVVKLTAGDYTAETSETKVLFDGFLKVWNVRVAQSEDEEKIKLPPLSDGEEVNIVKIEANQHFTKPPARYSEGTLVRELEAQGIGRPSTYAQIISTLLARKYVRSQKKRLIVTELGMEVNSLLQKTFPDIFEEKFTAKMEQELDEVEKGEKSWQQVLTRFYESFSKKLAQVENRRIELRKQYIEETGRNCPQCGAPLLIRWGRYGKFIACSKYPECKYTEPFDEDAKEIDGSEQHSAEDGGRDCPQCGAPLRIRQGRYGKFLACSKYPECKYTEPISDGKKKRKEPIPLDEKCPKCGAQLLIKYNRWGGKFIACSQYPKCDYSRPLALDVLCPKCQTGKLVERISRKRKKFYSCERDDCDFVAFNKPISEKCPNCGAPTTFVKKYKGVETKFCAICDWKKET